MLKQDPEKLQVDIISSVKKKILKREQEIRNLKLAKKEVTLAKTLRSLAYLQELKKATQTKSHPFLNLIVYKDLSQRLKVPVRTFDYMSYPEIKESLKKNGVSRSLAQEIKERGKVSAVIMENLEYHWIYDKEVKKFLRANNFIQEDINIKELKGVVASRGFIKGRVSLCVFSTSINKVKKGDILVSGMTTPDFVPAMKKAAAIITDEGGITSHAAIVSRELKKPCIIGTKIATKVLKDGDLVEVDANNGVVRILKGS